MMKSIVRGTAVAALVAGALAFTRTPALADGPDATKDKISDAGAVQGAIVRTFAHERLVELKVERILDLDPMTPPDEKVIEKADKTDKKPVVSKSGLRVGQVIFVDVTGARVIDEKGAEKKRDDKDAWFTKDAGWSVLKDGQRVRVNYASSKEIPAPEKFPTESRTGGNLLVFVATSVELMPASAPEVMFSTEGGSADGAIVHLFSKEKLVELKVEHIATPAIEPRDNTKEPRDGKAPRAPALRVGEVIFLQINDAVVYDEKGVERKRDDKSAWFSKDDGWHILKEGHRARVEYTGTQEIPAPKDFPSGARVGGNILVYRVTVVRALADTK